MKRIVLTGIVGVFLLGMASCGGGGHTCDAYRTSDYTKYKSERIGQNWPAVSPGPKLGTRIHRGRPLSAWRARQTSAIFDALRDIANPVPARWSLDNI